MFSKKLLCLATSALLFGSTFAAAMPSNSQANLLGQQAGSRSVSSGNLNEAANEAVGMAQTEFNKYKSKLPEWLQRIDFSVTLAKHYKPLWYIRTIQPLWHNPHNMVFVQGQLSSQSRYTTSNLGVGYRHLLANKTWIFGVNSFFDREWRYGHERLGAGLEAIGQYATFRANYYGALTGKEKIDVTDGVTTYERALSGYDVSAEVPVPFLPWALVHYTRYVWWRHYGASNIEGYELGLHLFPIGSFETEVGISDDNASKYSYYLNLDWHFGRPDRVEFTLADTPFAKHGFIARDLSLHMLDYVQRENQIIVQAVKTGSSGIIISRGN